MTGESLARLITSMLHSLQDDIHDTGNPLEELAELNGTDTDTLAALATLDISINPHAPTMINFRLEPAHLPILTISTLDHRPRRLKHSI